MSSSRDSAGTYQDGHEDATIAAGQSSKDRREKAKEEKKKRRRKSSSRNRSKPCSMLDRTVAISAGTNKQAELAC